VEQAGEQAMKDWRPPIDLDRLTAALGADILGATDEEIRRAYAAAGRSVAHAADDVRRQIAAVSGEPDKPDDAVAESAVRSLSPLGRGLG
jgi:hypothetical protein